MEFWGSVCFILFVDLGCCGGLALRSARFGTVDCRVRSFGFVCFGQLFMHYCRLLQSFDLVEGLSEHAQTLSPTHEPE